MLDLSKNLRLANHVLKRYEPNDGLYYFYNAKSEKCWKCDVTVGSVVTLLTGDLCFCEIIEILSENNPDNSRKEIKEIFEYAFNFLLEEGFIAYAD